MLKRFIYLFLILSPGYVAIKYTNFVKSWLTRLIVFQSPWIARLSEERPLDSGGSWP